VASALTLLLLLAGVGASAVRSALSPRAPTAPEVLFTVSRGESLGAVARNLEDRSLVRNAVAVEWLARFRGLAGELRAGEYRLSAALAPGQILSLIARGEVETYEVVLPEGFTAAQIGNRLEAEGLVQADAFAGMVRDPGSAAALGVEGETLEGYLFPETYRLPRGLAPREIARVFVEQFLAEWQEIEPRARGQGLSMRDVVILASIVEKESGAPEERPLIASVFRNRLARGMRLESDPTVIYGIADFDGNLRRRDLDDQGNPYNTYRIGGLPPGPIANPGAESLRAAVSPADSDYLYFVSKNDGTHAFSRTYREHVNAVNRYQRRLSR
jgi:UPF0755 protein